MFMFITVLRLKKNVKGLVYSDVNIVVKIRERDKLNPISLKRKSRLAPLSIIDKVIVENCGVQLPEKVITFHLLIQVRPSCCT